jgi:hypothetical protein
MMRHWAADAFADRPISLNKADCSRAAWAFLRSARVSQERCGTAAKCLG